MNRDHLQWPFFADAHRELARGIAAWCGTLPVLSGAPGIYGDSATDLYYDNITVRMNE